LNHNIFLITIDTLRKDHCSCYGYKRKITPFLDSLANDGIYFKNTFSNGPLTPRSFPSILGSIRPFDYKEHNLKSFYFPEKAFSIAEIFKAKGYTTVAFQAGNPFISKYYGYDKGFDFYFDYLFDLKQYKSIKIKNLFKKIKILIQRYPILFRFGKRFNSFIEFFIRLNQINNNDYPFISSDRLNNDVINWLKDVKNNKPIFMWIHYMDVHHPQFPKDYITKELGIKKYSNIQLAKFWADINNRNIKNKKQILNIVDLYDSEIMFLDSEIEKLFNRFKQLGYNKNNSTFIITSDHGEEFGEHGGLGHEMKLYNEMLMVPYILHGKGIDNISHMENSLIELINTKEIILSIISNKKCKVKNRYIFAESLIPSNRLIEYCRLITIQDLKYKLIYNTDNKLKHEFYNLNLDKNEQMNLINCMKYYKIIQELKIEVEKYIQMRPLFQNDHIDIRKTIKNMTFSKKI